MRVGQRRIGLKMGQLETRTEEDSTENLPVGQLRIGQGTGELDSRTTEESTKCRRT